jgi:hypothetical protein
MGPVPEIACIAGNSKTGTHIRPGIVHLRKKTGTYIACLQIAELPILYLVSSHIIYGKKPVGAASIGNDDIALGCNAIIQMGFTPYMPEIAVITLRNGYRWAEYTAARIYAVVKPKVET